jgi:hypothetical protein
MPYIRGTPEERNDEREEAIKSINDGISAGIVSPEEGEPAIDTLIDSLEEEEDS